jgi:hypothetical protein
MCFLRSSSRSNALAMRASAPRRLRQDAPGRIHPYTDEAAFGSFPRGRHGRRKSPMQRLSRAFSFCSEIVEGRYDLGTGRLLEIDPFRGTVRVLVATAFDHDRALAFEPPPRAALRVRERLAGSQHVIEPGAQRRRHTEVVHRRGAGGPPARSSRCCRHRSHPTQRSTSCAPGPTCAARSARGHGPARRTARRKRATPEGRRESRPA